MTDYSAYFQEVAGRISLVEVIGQTVTLTPFGAEYRGLCPFHAESTPSFYVNPDKGVFYCFGCNAGGGLFPWLRRAEGLDFAAATAWIAQHYGVAPPDREQAHDPRAPLYKALEAAALAYRDSFGGPAALYISQRFGAVAGAEIATSWRLGRGWVREYPEIAHYGRQFVTLGVYGVSASGELYDAFRKRLVIPICDARGRVVSLAGRALDDAKPKYKNTKDSPIWHKGDHLFGLNCARATIRGRGEALLVEGYFDVIVCHVAGHQNAVASMGTALTDRQAHLLRQQANRVAIWPDGDDAGLKSALRSAKALLRAGMHVSIIETPDGSDPGEMALRGHAEAPRRNGAHWLLDVAIEEAAGRDAMVTGCREIIGWLRDPDERDEAWRYASRRSGLRMERLVQSLATESGPAGRTATLEERLLAYAIETDRLVDCPSETFADVSLRALAADLCDGTPLDEAQEALRARLLTDPQCRLSEAEFTALSRRAELSAAQTRLAQSLCEMHEATRAGDRIAMRRYSDAITVQGHRIQDLLRGVTT